MTVNLILAAVDCARSKDNPDTCGVCGEHFVACEADRVCYGDDDITKSVPACAGARVRHALIEMRALCIEQGRASMFSAEELRALLEDT